MSQPSAPPRGPSVLVTGAAGYVGRLTLAALAARRSELSALVALDVIEVPVPRRLPDVEYVTASVFDPSLGSVFDAHRIDTVVHLASVLTPPKDGGEELAHRVDVEGTRNVLACCVAARARRLVVTTSGAAYGYHPDNPPWLTEDAPLRGNEEFPYARNKRLIEAMLRRARERHPDLEQVVFRPGTIIGEGVSTPVTALFERRVILGVRGWESPFVFIWDQDVVECLVRAVFGGPTGSFNLAGDGAVSPREIAERLGKPYLAVPAPLLRLGLAVLRRLGKIPWGPEQVKFLAHRPVLHNRRLKEQFGYTPRKSSREAFELWAGSSTG